MNHPIFRIDWTVNIATMIAVTLFIAACFAAWYDLKNDVRLQEARIKVLDAQFEEQRKKDETQDLAREKIVDEIKETLRDNKNEIRQEFRDLRNDIFRSSTTKR